MLKKNILYILVFSMAIMITIVSYFDSKNDKASDEFGGNFSIPVAKSANSEQGVFNLKDHQGKVIVLYFGYTTCPDVCPTALAMVGNSLKKLPKEVSDQIQPLFVSVDPQRDTLDKLALYGSYFSSNMLAGTDTASNIDKLTRQFGAFYRITKQEDSEINYTVDHTSTVYLIDKSGKLADTVGHADILATLAQKITSLTQRES